MKWEGPFKVVSCFANGTYQLADLDGTLHASRVNGLRLKIYHARLMMVEKDEMLEENFVSKSEVDVGDGASLALLFAVADHE